ncbi:MAG TPA: SLBB domain-containing protein [Pyrinomonadaceae bacterium]|nr:SLBB domain-containing protein [Pyrinomonadaceae bacterium]
MKFRTTILALALFALLAPAPAPAQQDAGAAAAQNPAAGAAAPSNDVASMDTMGVKKYLLGPGDEMDLRVYNEPQFNGTLVVNDEGKVEVPFVDVPVVARCRTDREVKADIVEALSKYLKRPQVSLRVTAMRSRPPAVVFGAVRQPARIQMQRRARLLDIIAASGGVTDGAGGNIQVFHTEPLMCPEPEDDLVKPIASVIASDPTQVGYDLYSLNDLRLGKEEANPVIHPGDIIIVAEAQPVYITGAVVSPQNLYLRNGLQLTQAIAMVGGLRREAKASALTIYRRKEGTTEHEKLIVNFNDIRKEKAPDVVLQPYDIIEVQDTSGSFKNSLLSILKGSVAGAPGTLVGGLPHRVIY